MIPLQVSAQVPSPDTTVANTVVFTEVQTNGVGTGTTTQEIIEFYNPSEEPVNLLNWSVVYVNTSNKETVLYAFSQPLLLLPDTFLIGKNDATALTYLPDIVADFTYTNGASGLAATAGRLLLKDQDAVIVDTIGWTSATAYVDDMTLTNLSGGNSAQRRCDEQQKIIKTGLIINDFYVGAPTPSSITCDPPTVTEEPIDETPSTDNEPLISIEEPNPDLDSQPRLRLPVVINELFIDPVSPLTDANDEFVELYNPNTTDLDISGYTIRAGTTTKYSYTFPQGTAISALSYISITSMNTPITLNNTGATVELSNDLGELLDATTYSAVSAGNAWARGQNGDWTWTTSPTPDAQNTIIAPLVPVTATKVTLANNKTSTKKSKVVTSSAAKKKTNFSIALPVQLNEIYPDPKSPETDAQDEFVELYNPYPYAINITDYTIIAGATKKYTYKFPEGSLIAPNGYVVVDSGSTPLSLSNNGAEVKLLNNFDKEIDLVTYDKAKQGLSYAKNDSGQWQWTASVTKQAQNSFTDTASTTNGFTAVSGVVAGSDDIPLAPAPQPLPGWALAVLGVSAVCYAAYEYRFEARNYFYKFRGNRTAG